MPKTVTLSVVTAAKDAAELSRAQAPQRKWAAAGVVAAIVGIAGAVLIGLDPAHLMPQAHTSLAWLQPAGIAATGVATLAIVGVCAWKYRKAVKHNQYNVAHFSKILELGNQIAKEQDLTRKNALTLEYLQKKHRNLVQRHVYAENIPGATSSGHALNAPKYDELHLFLQPIDAPEHELRTIVEFDPFGGICGSATSYAALHFNQNQSIDSVATVLAKGVPFEAMQASIFSQKANYNHDLYDDLWSAVEKSKQRPSDIANIFHQIGQDLPDPFMEEDDYQLRQEVFRWTRNYLETPHPQSYFVYMLEHLDSKKLESVKPTLKLFEASLKQGRKITAEPTEQDFEHQKLEVIKAEKMTISQMQTAPDGSYYLSLRSQPGHAVLFMKKGEEFGLLDSNDRLYKHKNATSLLTPFVKIYEATSIFSYQIQPKKNNAAPSANAQKTGALIG